MTDKPRPYNWQGGVSFDMKAYHRAWRAKVGRDYINRKMREYRKMRKERIEAGEQVAKRIAKRKLNKDQNT